MARADLLTRMLILVAAATLPAVAALTYLHHDLMAERRDHLAQETRERAELVAENIGGAVEELRRAMAAVTEIRPGLDVTCSDRLRIALSQSAAIERIAILGADGKPACAAGQGLTPDQATPFLARPAVRAAVNEAAQNGEFVVGRRVAPEGGDPGMLPLALPYGRPPVEGSGVVVATLGLDWLQQHLQSLRRAPDITIDISDRNGVTLARVPQAGAWLGHPPVPGASKSVGGPSRGNAILAGTNGEDQLVGYAAGPDPSTGFVVSVGLSLPRSLADIDRAAQRGYGLLAAGAMISLCLALFAGERFVRRPAAALLKAARRWSAGDLSARAELQEPRHSEFGALAAEFNAMAAALGRQRRELEELNATLEARVAARTSDLVESRNRLQVEMAEREKTEASLRQAQKLQAVGQLAGGIAHDFNNLLTAIMGALELLRRRLPAESPGQIRLVDNALQAAGRGARLTGQLLAFSRRQRLLPAPTDMNATVRALSGLLASTLGRSIDIETDLEASLWPAMVDPSQLEAALLNLAINARDAMPTGGTLTIATRNVTMAGTGAGTDVPTPGDYVMVQVADTGEGMPPEVVARVFEPFFTTKQPGRGSGLGLSQVHGLAAQSGGEVRVESMIGEGTTVTLLLPRAHTAQRPRLAPQEIAALARPAVRVLVVDDDRDVRTMTAEMLSELGYAPTTAADGTEALALLDADPGLSVLLADYAMPGMNGLSLIRAAEARRADLRSLLVTGHAEVQAGEIEVAEALSAARVIRKPFTLATLSERLSALLDTPVVAREVARVE